MIQQLIFGCGHLTGGAAQGTSYRLVSKCLDAGVTRFDTAPLYGLGTAEVALGLALRRDGRRALVNTKVGLPRPRYGVLKSYLRALKHVVAHRRPLLGVLPPPTDKGGPIRGRFDPEEMALSFTESLRALGAPSVETLFLHEAYADNLSADAVAFLRDVQRRGFARHLGIANGARFDASLAALVPKDFLLQSAAPPEFFDGEERQRSGALILHSVINSFFWKLAADAPMADAVKAACRRFNSLLGDGPEATIALGYVLLGAAAPKAGLIYATTAPPSLDAFLKAMGRIAQEEAATEITAFVRARCKERAQPEYSDISRQKIV